MFRVERGSRNLGQPCLHAKATFRAFGEPDFQQKQASELAASVCARSYRGCRDPLSRFTLAKSPAEPRRGCVCPQSGCAEIRGANLAARIISSSSGKWKTPSKLGLARIRQEISNCKFPQRISASIESAAIRPLQARARLRTVCSSFTVLPEEGQEQLANCSQKVWTCIGEPSILVSTRRPRSG